MYKRENLKENLDKILYTNADLGDKSVIVRSCLNVVTDEHGLVVDDTRLQEALPFLRDIVTKAKRVIIIGHLGRPVIESDKTSHSAIKENYKKLSFWNIAERLQDSFKDLKYEGKKLEVSLIDGPEFVKHYVKDIDTHKVVLLENIRFNYQEEAEDENVRTEFAKELASLADIFINDSFPDYRESASTFDIAQLLPAYIGSTYYKEIIELSKFVNPERPFIAVLGGAKLSEKLDAMNSLLEVADRVLVGGAMAYTLLKAKGVRIGSSLVENDKLDIAKGILSRYDDKLILPIDHMISNRFAEPMELVYTDDEYIPDEKVAIDIGPKTIHLYKEVIAGARSILLNGPMGVFEWTKSNKGTYHVYDSIIANTTAYKLAGGGDTISAINHFHLKGFNHISTGGGAMLAFLSYEKFPTLDVILN